MQRNTSSAYTAIPLGNRFQRGAQQLRAWFWKWTKTEAALYVLVGAVLSLVAIHALWRPGYIAGGDFWPGGAVPGNLSLSHALSIWGTTTSGFGSPQYNPTTVFWGIIEQALLWMRISGPGVEFFTIAAPFVAEGLATAWLVRSMFPMSRIAALVAGICLPLSLYVSMTVTTYDFQFAIAFAAWGAGWLWNRTQTPVPVLRFAGEVGLASLGFMVLVSPPPLAVWLAVWFVGWAIVGMWRFATWRTVVAGLVFGCFLAILVNGWWLYAAWLTLHGPSGGVQQTFANPFSWGWVDGRASITNLLSMQGLWSWPRTAYYPWAAIFGRGLQIVLFLPAFFAVVGLAWHPLAYKKKWMMATIVLISLFVAQGFHNPSGIVNSWLYAHVPLYWLLRDPQNEADITMYLALYCLAGLGVESIVLRWPGTVKTKVGRWRDYSVYPVVFFGVFALSLGGYALWSGRILPNHSIRQSSSPIIHLPRYWKAAARYLNRHSMGQKVLLLPNDDFYQMPYKWGFYGADTVAQSLIRSSAVTLSANSGTYLGSSTGSLAFEDQLTRSIATQGNLHLSPLLQSLNIGWIVERGDIVWNYPGRSILSPSQVRSGLSGQRGIRLVRKFGFLSVYRVQHPGSLIQAYRGFGRWLSTPPPLVQLSSVTGNSAPWVIVHHLSAGAAPVGMSYSASENPPKATRLPIKGKISILPTTVEVTMTWTSRFTAKLSLLGPRITNRRKVQQWRRTVILKVPRPNGKWAIQLGSQVLVPRLTTVKLKRSVRVSRWTIPSNLRRVPVVVWESARGNALKNGRWGALENCNAYGRQTNRQAGLSAKRGPTNGEIEIKAVSHAACVEQSATVASPSVRGAIVTVLGKEQGGSSPQMQVLWNNGSVGKVFGSSGKGWQPLQKWIPIAGKGSLSLFVYAYGNNQVPPSSDWYRAPAVWFMKPKASDFFTIGPSVFPTRPGLMKVTNHGPRPTNLLTDANFKKGLWSAPFNADAYLPLTEAEAGLRVRGFGEGAVLSAKYDGVGEAQTISGIAGKVLQIRIQARDVRGNAPVAVLLGKNNQDLWSSNFASGTNVWQTANATVSVPSSESSASMILYAYGSGTPTQSQYRHIDVSAWPAGVGSLTWVGGGLPQKLPVSATKVGVQRYLVRIRPGVRMLTLASTFSPRWIVKRSGRKVAWRHVMVDGWLNGWIVPSSQSGRVIIEYNPSQTYGRAQRLALAILILDGLFLILWKRGRIITSNRQS